MTLHSDSNYCNVNAVSYTHLDVYKRQYLHSDIEGLRQCALDVKEGL